jgi:hypothetical protein
MAGGIVEGALREPHALLAFRATYFVRGAERRSAMATATDDSLVRNAGAALEEHPGASAPHGVPDRRSFTCSDCGHVLKVFGRGRHRVYFETGDERLDDPVMDGSCPGCRQRLPGRNGASAR